LACLMFWTDGRVMLDNVSLNPLLWPSARW
jgi:hypothetical protein